jgi:hypothetical protein
VGYEDDERGMMLKIIRGENDDGRWVRMKMFMTGMKSSYP